MAPVPGATTATTAPPPGIPPLSPAELAAILAKPPASPAAATLPLTKPVDDSAALVSGSVDVPPALRKSVTQGETLFVSVRRAEVLPAGGQSPVIAVLKLAVGAQWPLPFALHQRDTMLEGTTLTGDVIVVAWADHDGDPMTKGVGDLLGRSQKVRVPAKNVALLLTEEPK